MADQSLDIAINILTNEGQTKAAEVLKKVQTETGKATVATKDLKAMTRGLSSEFPVLGRLASLALNPITLSVAGITAAFSLWKKRVDDLSLAMGGVEMPDITQSQVQMIDKYSSNMGDMAKNTKETADATERLAQSLRDIAALNEAAKSAGFETGAEAATAAMGARAETAADLEAKAASLIAAAAGVSPEDKGMSDSQRKRALAAEDAINASKERIKHIISVEEDTGPMRAINQAKLGVVLGGNTFEELKQIEREGQKPFQADLASYAAYRTRVASNASLLSGGERGAEMQKQAAALRGENVEQGRATIRAQFERFNEAGGEIGTGGAGLPGQLELYKKAVLVLSTSRQNQEEIISVLEAILSDNKLTNEELGRLKALLANTRRN